MSRLDLARPAIRPAMKARILLAGPAGAGKTRTALIIATRLADGGKVLVLDTEKSSALTYADDFDFAHVPWEPPFDPRELTAAIRDASRQYAVTIIDSLSHFWSKEGGTLDIADGKFTGWKAARPAQESFVDAVMSASNHVILCVRSKMKHTQEEVNGRQVVRKLGMGIQQDDTLDYEVNVALEMDMQHHLEVTKSRVVTVGVGRRFRPGEAETFAGIYADWLAGGEPVAPLETVERLRAALDALPGGVRREAKQEWMGALGRPEMLRESQVAEAEALVARWTAAAEASAVEGPPGVLESPVGGVDDTHTAGGPARPPATVDGPPCSKKNAQALHRVLGARKVSDHYAAAVLRFGRPVVSFETDLSDVEAGVWLTDMREGRA